MSINAIFTNILRNAKMTSASCVKWKTLTFDRGSFRKTSKTEGFPQNGRMQGRRMHSMVLGVHSLCRTGYVQCPSAWGNLFQLFSTFVFFLVGLSRHSWTHQKSSLEAPSHFAAQRSTSECRMELPVSRTALWATLGRTKITLNGQTCPATDHPYHHISSLNGCKEVLVYPAASFAVANAWVFD